MELLRFVRVANIKFIILDEASDLEACKLLATNAKNLSLVISETLRHTHSACIRIDEATRMMLGLSKIETVSGMLHQVSLMNSISFYITALSCVGTVVGGATL